MPEEEQLTSKETAHGQLDWVQPDWFLQTLVNLTNVGDRSTEIGLTLLVGGFLVSGMLVNGARYFEGFANDMASAFVDPVAADNVRASFLGYQEVYNHPENGSVPLPTYIHLRAARFFNTAGNPIPGNRGVWWRGRIVEVSGFMLGTLQADQPR